MLAQRDLQRQYHEELIKGSYHLKVKYIGSELAKSDVNDRQIAISTLGFTIIDNSECDNVNIRLLKDAKKKIYMQKNDIKSSIVTFDKLSALNAGDNISGYAKYFSAVASGDIGDKDGMAVKYREFLDDYLDLPFYGQFVVQKFILDLIERKNDYLGAKELLTMLNEGCVKRKLTQICDREIAKQKTTKNQQKR